MKKYFLRDHISAFNNALNKKYNLDGVMYMESFEELQDDGNIYFFDVFKNKVSRERFIVEYQPLIFKTQLKDGAVYYKHHEVVRSWRI